MLGKSVNNKFYDTLDPALYDALDHALYHALRVALRPPRAAALVQLQKDLKNVR